MSKLFYIEKPADVAILTVQGVTELLPNMVQFVMDAETSEADEYQAFMAASLQQVAFVSLGVPGRSARGIELSFDAEKSEYCVRVNTPSARQDWDVAREFISALSEYCKTTISVEDGEGRETGLTPQTLRFINTDADIQAGLAAIKQHATDTNALMLTGVLRYFSMNADIINGILGEPDPIEAFSTFALNTQYPEAYIAKPMFYKDENEAIHGVYVLTENLPTVLPIRPYISPDWRDRLAEKDIAQWHVILMGYQNPDDVESLTMLADLDYGVLDKYVDASKKAPLDASDWVVQGLSHAEMEELARLARS